MKLTNEIVIQKAKSIGFDLIGFAEVEKLANEVGKLEDWLKLGYQSGMSYMERNIDKRKDVSQTTRLAKPSREGCPARLSNATCARFGHSGAGWSLRRLLGTTPSLG